MKPAKAGFKELVIFNRIIRKHLKKRGHLSRDLKR